MNKIQFFCLLATIAMAVASDDHDPHSRLSRRKVVIVEKEPEPRRPITYEVVKKVPEYKQTVYGYREPEEKVLVKVVKEDDRKYIVRPSYEPEKDVVVKILERKH